MAGASRLPVRLVLPAVFAAAAGVCALLILRDVAGRPDPGRPPAAVVIERGPPPRAEVARAELATPGAADAPRTSVPAAVGTSAGTTESALALDPGTPLSVRVFVRASGVPADAAAGLPVELALVPRDAPFDGAPILVATTDAGGIARGEIAWSTIEAARADPRGLALCARIDAIGWQRAKSVVDLPAAHRVREIGLWVEPGATLPGRLVDAAGRGVPGRVTVRPASGSGAAGATSPAEARADGWFEVGLRNGGVYDLEADAGEHGTARRTNHEVVFRDGPLAPITLVATGPGRIRGRVVGAHGRGAAGVVLHVALAEPERALDSDVAALGVPPVAPDGGRAGAVVTTADDGSFDVRGLRVARYRVGVLPGGSWNRRFELVPDGMLADGTLRVLVHARPHLVVRVVDERGAVLSRERLQTRGLRTMPRLAVEPLGPADVPREVETPDGQRVFELEPDGDYRVTLAGDDCATASQRVVVPPGAERIEVELALAPRATGWLAVDVAIEDAHASPVRPRVRVEDPVTHAIVATVDADFASTTNPLALPEGRHRVVIEGYALTQFTARPRPEDRGGRVEAVVDVARDATTIVRARLPEGARIRLRVAGVEKEGSEPPVAPLVPGEGAAVRIDLGAADRARSDRLEAFLLDDERAPVRVAFLDADPSEPATGAPDPGTRTSGLLPAGRFVLLARLADGRTARAPVELVDGATTAVVLEFR